MLNGGFMTRPSCLALRALIVFFVPLSCLADVPEFAGSLHLPAPTTDHAVAAATADGKRLAVMLNKSDKQPAGLEIIDTSDATHPKLTGFTPLELTVSKLAIADDGRSALLLSGAEELGGNKNAAYVLLNIDLADPKRPRELWRKKILAGKFVLSADAKAYAYNYMNNNGMQSWYLIFVSLKDGSSPITLEKENILLGDFMLSPHGTHLALNDYSNLLIWDLQSIPPVLQEQPPDISIHPRYECIRSVLGDGHVIAEEKKEPGFGVYEYSAGVPRTSSLPFSEYIPDFSFGCLQWLQNTKGDQVVIEDEYGQLHQMSMTRTTKPEWGPVLQIPIGVRVMEIRAGLMFADTTGAEQELKIYRMDRWERQPIDWQALAKSHASIMQKYNSDIKAKRPAPYFDAEWDLQKAGIIHALNAPVENISPQDAAAILNDYGFFLGKFSQASPLSIRFLRRAIELDPQRAVAHLNLADLLRTTLAGAAAEGRDVAALRTEITKHYQTYLNLGGKPNANTKSFLSSASSPEVRGDFCATVAAYANAGRLGELVSENGKGISYNGRKINLSFTIEGSGLFAVIHAYDSATGQPLADEELAQLPFGGDQVVCCGDHLGLLMYHNEAHIIEYSSLSTPGATTSLATGKSCEFTTTVKEWPGPDASEPELCKRLAEGQIPETYAFDEPAQMSDENAEEEWNMPSIKGVSLIDIANDNKPVKVAKIDFFRKGGVPCGITAYDVLNDNSSQFEKSPKRDLIMQMQNQPEPFSPIGLCGNHTGFFKHKNKVYFESSSGVEHRVATVTNGKVIEVCNFQSKTTVTGKKVASPHGQD
jgi:hypothetical protein